MSARAELHNPIPDELIDDFLKRLPYVSEGISNIRLLPGAAEVAFDLRPGFENQSELVASRIAEVAGKLCLNHHAGTSKTLVKRDTLPGSFRDDPHPVLAKEGAIQSFGRGRYGIGPKLAGLIEFFDLRARQMAREFQAEPHTFPSLIGADVLELAAISRIFLLR